jgi:hypothetical protein
VIGLRGVLVMILFGGASLLWEGLAPANPAAQRPEAPAATPARGTVPTSAVRVLWKPQPGDGTRFLVEVAGVDPLVLSAINQPSMRADLWAATLSVRVVPVPAAGRQDAPPLWGSYRVHGQVIQFDPRFPLEPGTRYRAELDKAKLRAVAQKLAPDTRFGPASQFSADLLVAEFTPPRKADGPATTVVAVYPTPDVLPENLLRFYIHFSAPMSRGEAYRRIRLLDAKGKPIEAAFLELDEELWSGDGTRFTLVFDPGRVKKGLKPREELGPILVAGQSYSLVIDHGWPDSSGSPLAAEFTKRFRTGPADEGSPNPKVWRIESPRPDSRQPLQVHFPEPLDRALLDRLIVVQDARGGHVPGRVTVAESEFLWSFTPVAPWRAGDYRLVVGTELEDVAGNSVASPFEVDQTRPITGRIAADTVELRFRVGAAAR